MAQRKIVGALAMPNGTVYRAGQEDALAAAAQAAKLDLSAHVGEPGSGSPLVGDWSAARAPARATGGDALPDGFPGKKALEAAGLKTVAAAQGMTRDELVALDGIGEATADAILAFKA